jgi:Skp family chaperone for outer membrane proteins
MRIKILLRIRYLSGVLLFGIMLAGLLPAVISTPSIAQDTTKAAVSIAIIDINGVLEQSTAIKKIRAIIDEENKKFLAST